MRRVAVIGAGVTGLNPSGGLKANGHPIGATGAAQVAEIVTQLRGEAGARQVAGARTGLVHMLGGNTATVLVSHLGEQDAETPGGPLQKVQMRGGDGATTETYAVVRRREERPSQRRRWAFGSGLRGADATA